jgi:hypothetical protein
MSEAEKKMKEKSEEFIEGGKRFIARKRVILRNRLGASLQSMISDLFSIFLSVLF